MTALVYDQRWKHRRWPRALSEAVDKTEEPIAINASCTLSDVMELSTLIPMEGEVSVIGGGGVIDAVKLACVAQEVPLDRYVTRGRAGIAAIPTPSDSRLRVIPTTLGTGSEANGKAVIETAPGRRRLIIGSKLTPREHSHIPEAYGTLSKSAVVRGALEIFFRAAAMLPAGSTPHLSARVEPFVLAAADLCRRLVAEENPATHANLIMDAARLSVATHQIRLSSNRLVWVWPLWYLSNELSAIARVSKIDATIALFPHVIAGLGEFGYGSRRITDQLEYLLGCHPAEFVEVVSEGLDQRVVERLRLADPETVAQQAFSQWGGPTLPLAGVSKERLVNFYREVAINYE